MSFLLPLFGVALSETGATTPDDARRGAAPVSPGIEAPPEGTG